MLRRGVGVLSGLVILDILVFSSFLLRRGPWVRVPAGSGLVFGEGSSHTRRDHMHTPRMLHDLSLVLLFGISFILIGSLEVKADQQTASMSLLRGDYAFTGTLNCAVDTVGFNASTLSRLGGGVTDSFSFGGSSTYNGDGTGTSTQKTLRINHQSNGVGQQPVEQFELNCDVVYVVNGDGTFNQRNTCQGTTLAGFPAVGATLTTAFNLNGVILLEGKVLLLSNTLPDVETLSRSTGQILRTICGRSLTAIRIDRSNR
jgi:hypothetical protein